MQHNNNHIDLFRACRTSDIETVKKLISSQVDLNYRSKGGLTGLHLATMLENVKITKLLLKSKADPNIKNYNNSTCLINACSLRNNKIINILLDEGADANCVDNYGDFALLSYLKTCKNNFSFDKNVLQKLIISTNILVVDSRNELYDIYHLKNYECLDDFYLKLLKGEITITKTKSARKNI